ncbi:hypothetical protein T492DRAFT_1014993 [Pavlovales sp. CCMP2436]|nr:hypothetical protein T492DRAFT_1014993 [Pavlovales sp. CCMP2436]|mmetsp:Transcript_4552/g.11682  ORF Transcript_4552/g.11682 Transcript_4552/m.11682 type:complete len:586 (-) Transcript_4552:235-1992(-)
MPKPDAASDVVTEANLTNLAYWRTLCPRLHVSDRAFMRDNGAPPAPHPDGATAELVRNGLAIDGFAVAAAGVLEWTLDVELLADGARALLAAGWPATALLIYDETWVMHAQLARLLGAATSNTPCFDIVCFAVAPQPQAGGASDGTRGFAPHRDRQPDNWQARGVPSSINKTFHPDGTPKFVTAWLALTDATPENSCLCFVPRWADPGYAGAGDTEDDPLARALASRPDAAQSIRAAPVKAGGVTFHGHRTIHWGTAGARAAGPPPGTRISLSCCFSDAAFEPPYLSSGSSAAKLGKGKGKAAQATASLPFPTHAHRAALVSAQLLNYSSLAATDISGWHAVAGSRLGHALSVADAALAAEASRGLRAMHRAFKQDAAEFEPSYAAEIAAKYAAFVAAATGGATGVLVGSRRLGAARVGGESDEDTDESDDGDALAELAAQQQAARAQKLRAAAQGGTAVEEEDEDDGLDEALDALLDAEAGGAAFMDDFDLLDDEEELGESRPSGAKRGERRSKKSRREKTERDLTLAERREQLDVSDLAALGFSAVPDAEMQHAGVRAPGKGRRLRCARLQLYSLSAFGPTRR